MMQISASPQPIIGVFRNSLILFKKSWLKLLPISILIVGLLTVLIILLPKQAVALSTITQHMAFISLAMIVGFECIIFWLFLILFYKCYRILIAADIKYSLVLLVATLRFFPSILVMFLYVMLVMLGIICFVIPGVFLALLLIYSFLAVLIDNKNIFSSFKYSVQLVWGNWWRTFVVFLIAFVLLIIIILVVIVGINFVVMGLLHLKIAVATTVMNITGMILSLFIWIFLANVFICQYYDLKVRRHIKESI
jgi:hypothetical protein